MRKICVLLCTVLVVCLIACSSPVADNANGMVTTIAGTGEPGFSGDGGPANKAELERPFGIAIDEAGNLFIGEAARIRKVDKQGLISTIAGTGIPGFSGDGIPADGAEVDSPQLSFDGDGNLWVLNSFQPILRKIDPNGVITVIAGTGSEGDIPEDGDHANEVDLCGLPYGPAIDKEGNAYISCEFGHVILKIDTDGIVHRFAGTGEPGFSGDGGLASEAQLFSPLGLDFDSEGNLYVADSTNSRIRKIEPDGIISTIAGNGTSGYAGDGGLAIEAMLSLPLSVAVDSYGNIYFTSGSDKVIRKIDSDGLIHTVAGGGESGSGLDGVPATTISFKGANLGLAIEQEGNLCVADDDDHRVRRITLRPGETEAVEQTTPTEITETRGPGMVEAPEVEVTVEVKPHADATATSEPPTPNPIQMAMTEQALTREVVTPMPTVTPGPKSCNEVDGVCLWLSFDGEDCIYDGPSEIKRGPVTFIYFNNSENPAGTNITRLHEGKTLQDAIDYVAEVHAHAASWMIHTGAYNGAVLAGNSHSWSGQLYPGIHILVCLVPEDGYFGGALTVTD